MAKKTKETYHASGKADHRLVNQGNRYAIARHADFSKGTSWQARAYMDGYTEAQDIERGHYTPAAIWMRTAHAERVGILHQASVPSYYAGRAFDTMRPAIQARIAAVIIGEPAPADDADDDQPETAETDVMESLGVSTVSAAARMCERAARAQLVDDNRERAAHLRAKHDCIAHLKPGKRMQGPRHAPGLAWPSGQRVVRSVFIRRDTGARPTPTAVCVWQWVAFDEDDKVLHVVEHADLWTVREIAAYNIADMYRFVRSHKGH